MAAETLGGLPAHSAAAITDTPTVAAEALAMRRAAVERDMRLLQIAQRTPRTRTTAGCITGTGPLAQHWPETARSVTAFLVRRGMSVADAEDVVQECALRVIERRVPFADAADLTPWCLRVARNLSVDLSRRQARFAEHEEVLETAAAADVHGEVEARLEWRRVLKAVSALEVIDRDLLLDVLHPPVSAPDKRATVRANVRRHRARQRLLAALTAIIGWLGGRRFRPELLLAGPAVLAALCLPLVTKPPAPSTPRPNPGAVASMAVSTPGSHATRPATSPASARSGVPAPRVPAARQPRRDRVLAKATAPTGDGIVIGTADRDPAASTAACVEGVPGVPKICVDYPPTSREISQPPRV